MKRTYITPQTEEVPMTFRSLLCASFTSDDVGIDFGGVDTEGVKDPSAPPINLPIDLPFDLP